MPQKKPFAYCIRREAFIYVRRRLNVYQLKNPKQIAQGIQDQIEKLLAENPPIPNKALLLFNIENLVIQVLDYCNRQDLPRALEMCIVEMFFNKIVSDNNEQNIKDIDIKNLKSLKMDDTEFEFNYKEQSITEKDTNYFFEKLRPNLNIYRQIKGFK